jgi:hypothetical protein
MDSSNKKYKASDPIIPKVEEPTETYNAEEKIYINIKDHPLFAKVIEKGLRESELGLGISHEEMKRRTKLRYPFLK